LSLTSQALDGRRDAPGFAAAILDACGVDASRLIAWAYDEPNARARFAALARRVSVLAETGDITAIELLKSAARSLADHGEAARQRLGRPSLGWSHAGGVFQSRIVGEEIALLLGRPVVAKLPPVGGALWRAAGLAGWDASAQFIAALGNSLENFKIKKGNR
jgi:N-acetylglucosamine kinase